jgi:steroid delta-isomerase-like uncharacterized protein
LSPAGARGRLALPHPMKARSKKRPAPKARAPARPTKAKKSAATADPAKIRKLAKKWFDELWNKRNGDALPRLMHPEATGDTEGGSVKGHAEFYYKLHGPLLAAFPDLKVSVDGIVAEGNNAVVRWTLTATHGGDMMGITASNRRVSVGGMTWLQYDDEGKVVAGWDRWNAAGLFACLRSGVSSATVKVLSPAD